jgi:hypothetical protein
MKKKTEHPHGNLNRESKGGMRGLDHSNFNGNAGIKSCEDEVAREVDQEGYA